MKQLFRIVEQPRTCSYLQGQTASLEYRIVTDLCGEEYGDLLARGYRRFGHQLFRPECPSCEQCVSLRVLVRDHAPSVAQRRVLRKNAHIRAEKCPVYVTDEHIDLFNRYHRWMAALRGWERDLITREGYVESFLLGGGDFAWQWVFSDGNRLLGVALMDETPEAISMVYSYYDPDWRPMSPGTLAVLTQLAYAKEKKLAYAYPGYWIGANPSMSYKTRFRPHEQLLRHPADHEEPVWRRA